MDRQTLRNWVHRYNAEGVSGTPLSAKRPSWPIPAVCKGFRRRSGSREAQGLAANRAFLGIETEAAVGAASLACDK
jgi:hypothetical protein